MLYSSKQRFANNKHSRANKASKMLDITRSNSVIFLNFFTFLKLANE